MNRIDAGLAAGFRDLFHRFEGDHLEEMAAVLIATGCAPREVLGLAQECIREVGERYASGEYYLPELILAGEMFKRISGVLKRNTTPGSTFATLATIVVGTPKGDLHSLGKDIFCLLAEASGFRVCDLGVDVEPELFVSKLKETGAAILGMSCLLTTTYGPMREVVARLEAKGLRDRVFVIIGGAATTKEMIGSLKVDAQTLDAYEGVRMLRSLAAPSRVGQ